jgi:hypothetical protein
MIKRDPWFFEERALAFAKLVLTKHHDVRPYPPARDSAVDLLVEIHTAVPSRLRLFGVQIVAFMDLPNIPDAEKQSCSHLGKDLLQLELPICVFGIGIRKPEGIYRWVVEPVVENGRPLLHRVEQANWQPLNEEGVDCLIGQANAWYESLNGNSTPGTCAPHLKLES